MHKVLHFPFPSQWHQPLNSQHSFIIPRWKCHCWSTPKTCSQASTSTIIHPISGTSVPHVFRTPLSCANLIDTAGNDLPSPPKCSPGLSVLQTCRQEEREPLKSVRWPSASQGTIWWLLPSQLGLTPPAGTKVARQPPLQEYSSIRIYNLCHVFLCFYYIVENNLFRYTKLYFNVPQTVHCKTLLWH